MTKLQIYIIFFNIQQKITNINSINIITQTITWGFNNGTANYHQK